MVIGDRLRLLRQERDFSQGEIEKRTGLLRSYISRVENGHTVPSIGTLEKFARALEVPVYQLFYGADESPDLPDLSKRRSTESVATHISLKDSRLLGEFRRLLSKTSDAHKKVLMFMAQKMAGRTRVK
jgi:transcriptional regulator with XRE-family HTH domain